MRRKRMISTAIVPAILLAAVLGGCGGKDTVPAPTVPMATADPAASTEPAKTAAPTEPAKPTEPPEPAETEAPTGRQDGERFEEVIIIEGFEETVRYEHVRNEALGFELDYDYESLERHSEPEKERFISCYDDPKDPWNYIEVFYDGEGADTAAAALHAVLPLDFDTVVTETCTLEHAGSCTRIDASDAKEGSFLKTAYLIPAGEGCIVAITQCTLESAEGFGRRFNYMLNTLSVMEK